jgi:hypothetical protein
MVSSNFSEAVLRLRLTPRQPLLAEPLLAAMVDRTVAEFGHRIKLPAWVSVPY